MTRTLSALGVVELLGSVAAAVPWGSEPEFVGPIYDGGELDYQPSIIHVQPDGQLLLVLERLRLGD